MELITIKVTFVFIKVIYTFMIEYNQRENLLTVKISVAGIGELYAYQKSVLRILNKIEINECDKTSQNDLKSIYELLGHISPDKNLLTKHEELSKEYKELITNHP